LERLTSPNKKKPLPRREKIRQYKQWIDQKIRAEEEDDEARRTAGTKAKRAHSDFRWSASSSD
jgi:hypothetical protein